MTTTTKAITEMTPVEIDTILAANWGEQYRLRMTLMQVEQDIKRGERYERDPNAPAWRYDSHYAARLEENRNRAAGLKAQIEVLRDETIPFNEEYVARGRWNRYYLVTNMNGHVHRGTDCHTCFPTTSYRWIIELADCDETAMVAEYGEQACTACFPEAPTMPGFGDGTSGYARRTQAEKDARQAEKDAKLAIKMAKLLEPELQFKGLGYGSYKVETVAGAKAALRSAIEARLLKDVVCTWARDGYNAEKAVEAIQVEADARHALDAKGVTAEELAKIEANVTKKVRKENPLAGI